MAAKVAKVEGGTRQRYITLKKFFRFAEDLHLNTHRNRKFPGKEVESTSQGAFCSTAPGAEFPVCSRARICHILSLISYRPKLCPPPGSFCALESMRSDVNCFVSSSLGTGGPAFISHLQHFCGVLIAFIGGFPFCADLEAIEKG